MKRILIVDDLPEVLEAHFHLLSFAFPEWEVRKAGGGEEALALMAEQPFDVVISDMRMPGMNGAELLNEVMRLYPRTVRLILSAFADQDQVFRSIGSTHQYLTKPCDLRSLKTAILRAANLEEGLRNEKLQEMVSSLERVPSLPELYNQLVDKLQDPEIPMEAVAEVIAEDTEMTAKILDLVNSAYFAASRPISNPQEALNRLGLDTIKSLVLYIHAFTEFDVRKVEGLASEGLWHHSLSTATLARLVAREEMAGQKTIEDSFRAGLLHDTGRLVMACNYPETYSGMITQAKSRGVSLTVVEQETFGTTHARVGGYLLGLWGLPVPVIEAIALHHDPSESVDRSFSPLTVVHIANALVNELSPNTSPDVVREGVNQEYLLSLDLVHRYDAWRAVAADEMAKLATG